MIRAVASLIPPRRRFIVEEARSKRWSFTVLARDEAEARELARRWAGFDDQSTVREAPDA